MILLTNKRTKSNIQEGIKMIQKFVSDHQNRDYISKTKKLHLLLIEYLRANYFKNQIYNY